MNDHDAFRRVHWAETDTGRFHLTIGLAGPTALCGRRVQVVPIPFEGGTPDDMCDPCLWKYDRLRDGGRLT